MKRLVLVGAVAIAAMALTGCDDRKCLESHTELMPMWIGDGKGGGSVTLIPTQICDKYEEKKP